MVLQDGTHLITKLSDLGSGLLARRWSGVRVLAVLMAGLGGWGVVRGLPKLVRLVSTKAVANPSLISHRRLHGAEAVGQLVTTFQGNYVTVAVATILFGLLAFHLIGVAQGLYARAPLRSLVAALFFGGSVISAMLLGLTVLKVSEFAFQHRLAPPSEQQWLEGGISFLNQLHLIFVYGWFLFLALGWFAAALGAVTCEGGVRWAGLSLLIASVVLLTAVGARHWIPGSGPNAPEYLVFVSTDFLDIAMGLAFLSSGVLGWLLSLPKKRDA